MRPTAVKLGGGLGGHSKLLMMGGRQDRSSQLYSTAENKWKLSPKLPLGHNITTTIGVNWKDEAVFTFIIDAQLSIKSAVLDLKTCSWTEPDTENTEEMSWALDLPQTLHKIDRLHIKTGICMDDGRIAVIARGRPEGLAQQITGLVLFFKVSKNDNGKYILTKDDKN